MRHVHVNGEVIMRYMQLGLALLLIFTLAAIVPGHPSLADGVYFNDSDPDIISSSAPAEAGSNANAVERLLSRWQ